MSDVLFRISLVHWVRRTIEKMNEAGVDSIADWNDYWFESYWELGGRKKSSGSKDCPKYAAYGLWHLGLIARGGRPPQDWPIERVQQELGKNVTYAVLALRLLKKGYDPEDIRGLWSRIREIYQATFVDAPARNEQGAVRVASILFLQGQIVSDD